MKDLEKTQEGLSGNLLVAHPGLLDPNFKQAVILLSMHGGEEGALGVIINRPLGKRLAEFSQEQASGVLANIPLYHGGPVEGEKVLFAAWKWLEGDRTFRLYFGVSAEKLESMILDDPDLVVRGFLGYAGWSEGQLEGELAQHAWVVCPIDGKALEEHDGPDMWKAILSDNSPEFAFLVNSPEDPSLN